MVYATILISLLGIILIFTEKVIQVLNSVFHYMIKVMLLNILKEKIVYFGGISKIGGIDIDL